MKRLLLLLILLSCYSNSWAEEGFGSLISPGDLAKSHAKYEGITKCIKCHKLGGGVPDKKCLDCHDKLANRIKANKSLHAKYIGKCIKCHRDHKGRSFKMISLDKNEFNHKLTGYLLEDKHAKVKCKKCHTKKGTFSGASRDCISCHKDVHKGKLGRDCERCHNFADWKDVKKFNHDKDSKYRLTGKHQKVKCKECHKKGRYKFEKYNLCETCHKDPHKGKKDKKYKKLCSDCHNTAGWKKVKIDHSKTKYPLTGKHKTVLCDKCHKKGTLTGIPFADCNSSFCHNNPHKRQFKDKRCETCHTTKTWKPSTFDHNSPQYKGYRLEGKHVKTDCNKCHIKGKYKPIAKDCLGCHKKDDVHKKALGKVCDKCHNAFDWKKAVFDHNRQSKFPLIGKHKETKCEKCHKDKRYQSKAKKCIDCHKDIHKGQYKEGCNSCHNQSNWQPSQFPHGQKTGFFLKGVHNDLLCIECHKTKGVYKGIKGYCNQCHTDPHFNRFAAINCTQCHSELSWFPVKFNHSQTSFPLLGQHRLTECESCHNSRDYNLPENCIFCHRELYLSAPDHVSKGYSQECRDCHPTNSTSWAFRHAAIGTSCSTCHLLLRPATHIANPTLFPTTCEDCHKSTSTWSSVHPSVSSGCATCHLNFSNPPKTASHNTNNWINCEDCHNSISVWSFTHPATTFPLNHNTSPSDCNSCHPGGAYINSGGCIECHTIEGEEVHKTNVNSGCLSCHPTGKD